jgi:hypothetical protein
VRSGRGRVPFRGNHEEQQFFQLVEILSLFAGRHPFRFGAGRFLIHDDYAGVAIYSVAAILSLWQAAANYMPAAGKQS